MSANLNASRVVGASAGDTHLMGFIWVACLVMLGHLPAGCIRDVRQDRGDGGPIVKTGEGGVGGISQSCGTTLYEPAPTVLGNLFGMGNLAADVLALYWIDAPGQVLRMPKEGGNAQVLAMQAKGTVEGTRAVALSEDTVYFTDSDFTVGYVKRVAKTGGNVTILARTDPSADQLQVDAGYLYWTTNVSAGAPVWRVPIDGGQAMPLGYSLDLSATPVVGGLAIDDANIYFTVYQAYTSNVGTVYRGTKDGGAFTALATGVDEPGFLSAADPDYLYFGIGLFHYDSYTQTVHVGKIARVPKNADAAMVPEIVASDLVAPFQILLDGDKIYWINQGELATGMEADSKVMRLAKPPVAQDGGSLDSPAILADCATGSWSLAVDDTYVYYNEWYGRVRRVAK